MTPFRVRDRRAAAWAVFVAGVSVLILAGAIGRVFVSPLPGGGVLSAAAVLAQGVGMITSAVGAFMIIRVHMFHQATGTDRP